MMRRALLLVAVGVAVLALVGGGGACHPAFGSDLGPNNASDAWGVQS
jgi:hypothetical protein